MLGRYAYKGHQDPNLPGSRVKRTALQILDLFPAGGESEVTTASLGAIANRFAIERPVPRQNVTLSANRSLNSLHADASGARWSAVSVK